MILKFGVWTLVGLWVVPQLEKYYFSLLAK